MSPREEMVLEDIWESNGKFLDFNFKPFSLRGLPVYVSHFVEPLLAVSVYGLQRVFHLLRSRAIAITPFHSILLYFKIICIHSSHVCRSFPLVPFPCVLPSQAISVDLSSPIVTKCQNYLECANSIITLRGIIPNTTF
jgi:hypothetical protein